MRACTNFCFVLFKCFHICSCCSIFNDQPRLHPVRRDSLYIIPHSFPFVKYFFKSFLSFFKVFFKPLRYLSSPPSWTAYILYHFAPFLSSTFFDFFHFCGIIVFRLITDCLRCILCTNRSMGIISLVKIQTVVEQ